MPVSRFRTGEWTGVDFPQIFEIVNVELIERFDGMVDYRYTLKMDNITIFVDEHKLTGEPCEDGSY